MSAEKCWKCKSLRKVDIIDTPDGWSQPPCYNCGDPGYIEPHNDRARWEHVFGKIKNTDRGIEITIDVTSKSNGRKYISEMFLEYNPYLKKQFDINIALMIKDLDRLLDASEYTK